MTVNNPVDALPVIAILQGTVQSRAAGTFTAAAAALVNGAIVITGGTTSAITTDTAANIIKQCKGCQTFDFVIDNGGSGTATLSAGAGVTLVGAGAASTLTAAAHMYTGVVTSPTTVKIYSITTG